MASPFDTLWASTAQAAFAATMGDTVSIRRGTNTTTGVTAQKFLGERFVNLDDGGRLQYSGCQWIIAKSAYTFDGVVVDPKSGDRIVEAGGEIWEISPQAEMAEVSELPGGTEWQLLTKRVTK